MTWQTEDIILWSLIIIMVGLALWLFHGSPTVDTALIATLIFVAGSEMLIWRKIYSVDKKTAVGFERVRKSFETSSLKLDAKFLKLEAQYEGIRRDLSYLKNKKG